MYESYFTVDDFGRSEFTEKRSVFIGNVARAESEAEANLYIKRIRSEYHDAKHNVFAYILRTGEMKYSDDGEPQGSAGLPVLTCLRKAGVVDVCAVVTRYFGGVLLGTGGLSRAYAKAASLAVCGAGKAKYEKHAVMRLCCSYPVYSSVGALLSARGAVIDKVEYADAVKIVFSVRADLADKLSSEIRTMSGGRSEAEHIGERFEKAKRSAN